MKACFKESLKTSSANGIEVYRHLENPWNSTLTHMSDPSHFAKNNAFLYFMSLTTLWRIYLSWIQKMKSCDLNASLITTSSFFSFYSELPIPPTQRDDYIKSWPVPRYFVQCLLLPTTTYICCLICLNKERDIGIWTPVVDSRWEICQDQSSDLCNMCCLLQSPRL